MRLGSRTKLTMNKSIHNFYELNKTKGFKIVHLNIRSLLPKIEQLRTILYDSTIDIITISETWLHNKHCDDLVQIEGFKLFRLDRERRDGQNKRGGGLAVYVNKSLSADVSQNPNLCESKDSIEAQWLIVNRENAKNILLCNIYRPPNGNIKKAFSHLNEVLNTHRRTNVEIFITGDLNIDYKKRNSPGYKQLLFFEKANNLKQMIKTNTRITKSSSSIIDLILTNAQYVETSGTLDTFISDHQPIFVVKKKPRNKAQPVAFIGRSYKNYSKQELTEALQSKNWESFYKTGNVNDKWEKLHQHILAEADNMCPIKNFKFKKRKPQYMNNNLIEQMKDRDYFYRKAKKYGNLDDWRIAKHLRNQTNKKIKKGKAEFIMQQLEDHSHDSSKFWRTIKSVFPNGKSKPKTDIKLLADDTPLEKGKVAEYIKVFFLNVGNTKIVETIGAEPQISERMDLEEEEILRFGKTTRFEVQNLTTNLSVTKSSGIPTLGPVLVKDSLLALNKQFTHLVNCSLDTTVFPDHFKEATVIPIPKPGNPTKVNNYRPISLLPSPGKIIEKVVHNQLAAHLEKYEILNNHQYGFRRERSTTHAITELLNQININLNKRTPTVALYIDFRKAFDCLQYPILITKLETLGLHKNIIDWIHDYLQKQNSKSKGEQHIV